MNLLPGVIVTREFTTATNPLDVEDLFMEHLDMRVFVINVYVDHAISILCEVRLIIKTSLSRMLWSKI